jgi:hypothetical protein
VKVEGKPLSILQSEAGQEELNDSVDDDRIFNSAEEGEEANGEHG